MSNTTFQYLTSGTSATYTTPVGCVAIHVEIVGAGGGGGSDDDNAGSAGGDTIFNSIHAAGGLGGDAASITSRGGDGGSSGTGSATLRLNGGDGNNGTGQNEDNSGGSGGVSYFGGAGRGGFNGEDGVDASTNTGSGGGGGGYLLAGIHNCGGGGGSGEYVVLDITSPASSYTYTIGVGGVGGDGGADGYGGGNGGSGFIRVTEYYSVSGSISLPDGDILVGNSSDIATGVAMSGDATIDNTGVISISSDVNLPGSPTTTTQTSGDNSTKIATTAYVDTSLSAITAGLDIHPACLAASTAALTATYNNGSSGVGATLTNSGTQAALTLDGVSLSTSDRVLIKNQSAQEQNGVYTVTTVGDGSTNWVLTRATDFDTASGTGVVEGAYVIITEGTAQYGTLWIETGLGPFTIGTTAIVFTQLQVTNVNLLEGDILFGNSSNIGQGIPYTGSFGVSIDGGGSVPSTGAKGYITMPYDGTITEWYIVANTSSSAVIDVLRSGSSIIGGGNKPTLTSQSAANAAVSGWTSDTVTEGDVIEFSLSSVSTATFLNLVLKVARAS